MFSNNVIFINLDQMNQNFYDKWNLFFKFLFSFEALWRLFEIFYQKSYRNKFEILYITYHILFIRICFDNPFDKNFRKKKKVLRIFSERKKNKYYYNVEIFQALHYWEARAPSTYFKQN